MTGSHIIVAALFAYVAVLVVVNRAMRRWDQQSQQERKRLEDSNADWRGLAAHRRVIIQELEARCDVLVSELDKAQRLGRRDEERYNCGDREVASGDIVGMCSVCHQRSYPRALEPAKMCPSCHHAITDSTATLGELSPGRYDDDESGVTVRCYCACHDWRDEAAP